MKTKERHKKIERCRYKVNETRLVVIYKRWDTLQDREALHRSKQEWKGCTWMLILRSTSSYGMCTLKAFNRTMRSTKKNYECSRILDCLVFNLGGSC
uniref:Uncharacterized protein LOC105035189 isoform X2 n=1 Tax=Elaeis guineensis var. tenera TaxID=51953 RepID=A0A6I9QIF5_ELAGV|nr:uncharacterized protein LOC105035189 isoform X2 [Elaeis guineensis]